VYIIILQFIRVILKSINYHVYRFTQYLKKNKKLNNRYEISTKEKWLWALFSLC